MSIDFSNNAPFVEEEPLVATTLTREDENEYSLRPQRLRETWKFSSKPRKCGRNLLTMSCSTAPRA